MEMRIGGGRSIYVQNGLVKGHRAKAPEELE
jgi:hypothetical protein